MAVYFANLSFLVEEAAFHNRLALIPKERREAILRMKNPADRRRSLGAGLLLEYGLQNAGYSLLENMQGKICVHIEKGTYGKPYIAELPDCCFNLSHAGDYAAAVFAGCTVGIDIERIRDVRPGMQKRFFTAEECAFLSRDGKLPDKKGEISELTERQKRDFFWIWTRKESYIKAVGEGMHLPLRAFSVLEDKVNGEHDYYLHTWEPAAGYRMSVCAAEPLDMCMAELDLAKSI